jgi:hypothetical protein
MAQRRTIDLLPEIFRTDTNRKFLSATLDQLTQEPSVKKTRGYVGRRVGPGVNPADNYVTEPSTVRNDYQLEPGVVFLKSDTATALDAITYPGIIDALDLQGAQTTLQDRLFQSQYYAWDGFCDLDKFSNYSQYYWLPLGPDSVDVGSTNVPLSDDFVVTRNANSYSFSDIIGNDPIITLVRGGNYTFEVNQLGHNFWIQTAPGVDGRIPSTPNISSRDVLGVENNGEELGTVTFNVPLKTAQDFYYNLTDIGSVDLITALQFNQINNVYVDTFLDQYPTGIDGITNLNGRTVIFNTTTSDGWEISTQFDPLPQLAAENGLIGSYDSTTFDQTTYIDTQSQRYSVWRIQYQLDSAGQQYMVLQPVLSVNNLSRFYIAFGTQYSNTQWYKNALGYFEQMPLLTATLDVLYYQDSTNPNIFGQIKLIDPGQTAPLSFDDIVGSKNYIAPNGVEFTNGLKVQFRGPTIPAQYQDLEFYVEGVGTGPGIDARVGFVDGEAYFGPYHTVAGQKITGAVADDTVFQQYIYNTYAESIANPGAGTPVSAPLPTQGVSTVNVGNGIKLLPVDNFVTPETYTRSTTVPYDTTPYDVGNYDETLNAPEVPDYLTINRASQDRNAWSRSNRWFHIDVIRATAAYNNTTPILDNSYRGKRPIIEFRANLELYNSGTQAKTPVNIIDRTATDAFSNINGQTGYSTQGYTFADGSLVIFAADIDPDVRNKIYRVTFIDPDGNPNSSPVINLVPIDNGEALINQTVVCLSGINSQGLTFWFDGTNWIEGQQKTNVNQAPLFNVYDIQGRSFGDSTVYPSTNFGGCRLFGYAVGGTQATDEILGFALKYLNINNVGDIVFENFLYTDTFNFVQGSIGETKSVSDGFVRQYIDRVSFADQIGWQTAAAENRSRQVFRFTSAGVPLILDVPVANDTVYAPVQVFIEGNFIDPDQYTVTTTTLNSVISFAEYPTNGTIIEVQVISDVASNVAFYQVPLNLENNPLNVNSNEFTLGTIRTHYESICQNLQTLSGPINGANNTRDLGNIIPYGDNIVQHSSPLALTGTFLRERQYELFNAVQFNSQEYEKYKARLLDLVAQGDFVNSTATEVLDTVMQEISLGRSQLSPFYWSDMIPAGETYTENTYTYNVISTPTFDTIQTYNFTSANFLGLLVFLNGELLTLNYDYTVSNDSPTLTISTPLAIGDVIIIREYPTTYGSYVPNTPTKVGLFPAYKPEIYIDQSYVTPTTVIRGHDGSITRAFGDVRDTVLLEFETRIFNNLKVDSAIPLTESEVVPGQFRVTDYTLAEINEILSTDFLNWVGWNKLDYTTQTYLANNEFTYNYSQSGDRLNRQPLLGAWRGIYNYFYDTETPNTTPWEMLGFSQMPDWWENYYGPAPYTSGNLVLWEDLAAGLVKDPNGEYVIPRYVRPGLTQVIPSDSEGALISPLKAVVGSYDATSFRRSWTFGDNGPVEASWRNSSAYPFAVMRLLALTRPAKFFSLFVDRDSYKYNANLDQYLWKGRYRLDAKDITPIYGNGNSMASYIDWIVDYNQQLGTDSTTTLTTRLANLDVRLCWRLAAFSDKSYLKIFTERSTPQSLNTSLLLPDESYQLMLYKNQAFDEFAYSSVIIQSTDTGWQVLGYSATEPYFNILTSRPNGLTKIIEAGGSQVRVPIEYTNNVARVPYGYVFTSRTAVCDFLISYGKLLEEQGWVFEGTENGLIMDWTQMATEFLYWSTQGWVTGSLINLNPGATKISITRPQAVAESIMPMTLDNIVLNQNRQPLTSADLLIDRLDNTFRISTLTANTINYLNLRFTNYEHIIVLDNTSIFSDLIYQPATGARQSRILVSGTLSADWNGTVNAPGFVLNQDNIQDWKANRKYTKGEIVLFKDEYWTASTIINPSQEFNYALWLKSDYDQIQKGLLPNAANASDQLQNAYSVYTANLEQEVDLFSYGLIGFRPREYMQALNLDDVSQVNLYQQFLGSKGTVRSAELFSFADLGKETAQYDIYEYWAMLRSQYGANANRSYFELLLNQAQLTSNPSLIEVIQPGEQSNADQTVLLENVWKESYKLTSTNILPTTTLTPTDTSLPTAGYVNLNDADITLFSLDDPQALNSSLTQIGVGTIIWVAKTNSYDWNIYRAERVPGDIIEVADNLDGVSLVTFDKQHGLVEGDYLIIRYFDAEVNGAYRVRSVPSLTTVLIDFIFVGDENVKTGTGVGFTLQTTRVAQPSDIGTLPYATELIPGAKAWVNDNGQGLWTVLEKQDVYSFQPNLEPQTPEASNQFGAAVSQGFQNLTALVGAPGYNPLAAADAPGAVYAFVRVDTNQYEENSVLTVNATGIAGYGNAIDIGDQSWAIVGASKSNTNRGYAVSIYRDPGADSFDQRQLLVAPDEDFTADSEFGKAVTMSLDERWMYIGAPGINKVYAYGRVDTQFQSVEYTTDGGFTYNWSDSIVLTSPSSSHPQQLSVVLNNTLLKYPSEWDLVGDNVVLTDVPPAGQNLRITRQSIVQLDQTLYSGVTPSATSGAGTGAIFTVNNIRGAYSVVVDNGGEDYSVGDTVTIAGTDIGGASPANDLVLTVTQTGATYTASLVAGLTSINVNTTVGLSIGQTLSVISGTGAFGSGATITGINSLTSIEVSVANATSGFVQFYADPGAVSAFTQSGSGIGNEDVFDLSTYLATAIDIFSFTVTVDGEIYRPFIDYTFNNSTTEITFTTIPGTGANIIVSAQSYFEHFATLTGPVATTEFGHSISTTTDGRQIMIGAPAESAEEGRVYVYARAVERFQVTDATQTTYTTVQTITGVPEVVVNGEFLVNTALNLNGTFTVTGANTVEISTDLNVGDIIDISTNQFKLIDKVESSSPFETGRFGHTLDQCINNCSLYIATPYQGDIRPEAGQVEFFQNQARIFGSVPTTVANPTLTPGQYISINNYYVELEAAPAWSSSSSYLLGSFVSNGGSIYTAIKDVPINNSISDTTYWSPVAWTDLLASQITSANIPNVLITPVANVRLTGNGTTKAFNIGALYSSATTYTPVVYINNVLQTSGVNYTYDNDAETITFISAPINTDVVLVLAGRMTIQVKNYNSAQPANKLQVLPGTGTLFTDLGVSLYANLQTITSPVIQDYAHFGQALFISDSATTLVVGAPDGSLIQPCIFDNNTTTFDASSTRFADTTVQSGAVYIYDALPATNPTVSNPTQFVFGQQIYNNSVQPLDQFGAAVDLTTGTLMAGAPGYDRGDSQLNYGQVLQFVNENRTPAWTVLRVQQPAVDINLLNTVFMYDRVSGSAKQYFDYFDPLQGRLLGVVRQNLDYIGAIDPAQYNVGALNNSGNRWGEEHVGEIWWNVSRARFIDPNQDDITYASRRWGQLFPGSSIDVYQWVSSPVPPSQYTGPGTALSTTNYVVSTTINEQGIFSDVYYFWATGIQTVDRGAKKTLSVTTITRYIEAPRSSGISYIAPINSSTIAIYNGLEYISAQDTILHVEYDRQLTDAAVNVEYQLIPQDRADGFLVDSLYRKLLDSFSGADTAGNAVPDPLLPPSERYGVAFRPRQSMFINRFLALQNYLTRANEILAQFPVTESRSSQLLNSAEPEPAESSGEWDLRVANYEELTYQDLNAVALGYRYLVASDSTNNGLWTIYEVQSGLIPGSRVLGLIRVQNYDTRLYWERINWYRTNYDPLTRVLLEVPNYSALDTITVPESSVVKVTANAQGKWELYILESGAWVRVGLQDGTIRFKEELWDYSVGRFGFDVEVFDAQYFDQSPVIETRKIIQAINEELFVGDLLIERNRQLVLMFNFILSEQIAPNWLTKTSLIDVDHVIRELVPFQVYRQDNQDFVLNYIQEVKPYHVQIREFNLIYRGSDTYQGTLTDFDLPAYWDADQNLFISPVLDDTGTLSTTSSVPSTSPLWETFPYNQWYQNYLLGIEGVTVVSGGAGYTTAPEIVVTGECVRQAIMVAEINSAGALSGVTVVDPGEGYSTTALITVTGGGLPDATLWAQNLIVTAGDNIITDANNVYRVQTDGVLGDIPPTSTSGTSTNGGVVLLYLGTVARAVASMGNSLVRDITTTIKYDRYQYSADFTEWQANLVYNSGDLVRYDARVWSANADNTTGTVFDPTDWTVVPAGDLSGINRTMGYYNPSPNEPGLDLALLVSGVDYPGVQVAAPGFDRNTGFDVGNYDINPFDNISYGPEGQPTYDPAILDAIYESEFTDPYLGTLPAPAYGGNPPTTGPNPIIVDGGEFVDTYSSHAPEELVPGAIYDTLDMRVFTTPGADWEGQGHGFPLSSRRYLYDSTISSYSFADLLDYTAFVAVFDVTNGVALTQTEYTVDWVNYTIEIISGVTDGDTIGVYVASVGGGNQLYSNTYVGNTIGNTIIVPIQYSLINDFAIFANGIQVTGYTFAPTADGFSTAVLLPSVYTSSDRVVLTALGTNPTGTTRSWSLPTVQSWTSDGSLSLTLTNSLQGTNPIELIVSVNGVRATPYEGARYISDGTTTTYELPNRGGYSQGIIADNDVFVYVNNSALTLGVDFVVDGWDGSSDRTITLTTAPAPDEIILISVRTAAQYFVNANILTFRPSAGLSPSAGDIVTVMTWNDTSEQGIYTQVFVGPESQGVIVSEPYDDTLFDEGNITGDPGSFDFSTGTLIETNRFDTGQLIVSPERLIVTLDGNYLFEDTGYIIDGSIVEILGAPINAAQVVSITNFTQSVVPGAIAFRIFQDMRGQQTSYRITEGTTTVLVQDLPDWADIIYVEDASKLAEPNLSQGLFGMITIDGERITYRERDTANNTVSGLRRGTAGTAAAPHFTGAKVYEIGIGNRLPMQYQNTVVFDNVLANGTDTVFVAESINTEGLDSTDLVEAVEVYVGGIRQTSGYTITASNPVAVTFNTAPTAGYQVTILVSRGQSWYSPDEPGVPLQEQTTFAARFIRGD